MKISKNTEDVDSKIKKLVLKDTYRTLQPTIADFTSFQAWKKYLQKLLGSKYHFGKIQIIVSIRPQMLNSMQ